MIFNSISNLRSSFRFLRLAVVAGIILVGSSLFGSRAEAQVFHSVRGLLGNHFQGASSVGFLRLHPSGSQKAAIEKRIGQRLLKSEYVFYVAKKGEQVVGYALFDQERGQHEMIDFATFFDATGKVTRVEVVAYREPYGDGIRSARFRRQFVGRSAASSMRPGKEIDVISGATLSTGAMVRAVKRAAVLLEQVVLAG